MAACWPVPRGTRLVVVVLASIPNAVLAWAQPQGRLPPPPVVALQTVMPVARPTPGTTRAPERGEEDRNRQVAAVARKLHCPICQGYNLWDCPLEVCEQMREQIRERLAAGWSEAAITAEFVELYGPQVLPAPPAEGVYLLAWVVPVAVMLLLAGTVVFAWQRAPRPARAGGEPMPGDAAAMRRFAQWAEDE